MQKNKKTYASDVEAEFRYNIFKTNYDFVNIHNNVNDRFAVSLNQFADMTAQEFASIYNGMKVNKVYEATEPLSTVGLPTSIDWNAQGYVTPIKNQGQCGSCWSFSTTGSTESAIALAISGTPVGLSEQNLMDCSTSYGNQGCNGGLMDDAFQYIIATQGIDTESSYPYQAVEGNCNYNPSNSGGYVTGYTDVTSGSESALQIAAASQPVSVAIDASHSSFQLYTSGVYYEPACSSTVLDHGVLVVGYGSDNGDLYWIVKNSWGTSWGMSGYIWMARNQNNNCGIATQASYPTGATSAGGSSGGSSGGNSGGNSGNTSGSSGGL